MSTEKNPSQAEALEGGPDANSATVTVPKTEATDGNDTTPVTDPEVLPLSDLHLEELRRSGISDDVIRARGIYTATELEQLPASMHWAARSYTGLTPVLVFPEQEAGRGATCQIKPAPGAQKRSGEAAPKYLSPLQSESIVPSLLELKPVTDTTEKVLIVEGTKQGLCVESVYSGDDRIAIYGITGIDGWRGGNAGPSPAFSEFMGLPVYIVPDADAASNPLVYDGAAKLGEHCRAMGARQVAFVRFGGVGKQGVDDVLGAIDEAKRRQLLDLWLDQAGEKPASTRPKKKPAQKKSPRDLQETGGRVLIPGYTDPDRMLNVVAGALAARYGGNLLFRRDDQLVYVAGNPGERKLRAVDESFLRRLVADVCELEKDDGRSRLLSTSEAAILMSEYYLGFFPPLVGLSESPVMSPTGRIVATSGYDEETKLLIELSPGLQGFSVPERPTESDVSAAVYKVLDILSDFCVKSDADRTRMIGAMLTPLVRPMCPTAPGHVISANVAGAGKGLFVDVNCIIATGRRAPVQALPKHEAEMHKMLAAKIFAAETFVMIDECSNGLDSSALCAVLTSENFTSRVLGESRIASVKNVACFMFAGNQVAVSNDLARRMVAIDLHSNEMRPEFRTGFRHPNLIEYVKQHRKEILEALFTLIQAWIVAGRPAPSDGSTMGSFEVWYEIVGGVLELAGFSDLMKGVVERRDQYNEAREANIAHLLWVSENVEEPFRAHDVVKAFEFASLTEYVPLPDGIYGKEDVTAYKLSRQYGKLTDAPMGGFLLRCVGYDRTRTKCFKIEYDGGPEGDELPPDGDDGSSGGGPEPSGGGGGTPTPADGAESSVPVGSENASAATSTTTVYFDLETGDAGSAPVTNDPGFVRLATYSINGEQPQATTNIRALCDVLTSADRIVGHNIVSYDLPLLEHLFGLSTQAEVVDTLILSRLADPSANKIKHDLNSVAERYGVQGKLGGSDSVLKGLAKEYGGFEKIPVDNEEYVAYALQDVQVTVDVLPLLQARVSDGVGESYARREHAVMQRISDVQWRGVRIDVEKLEAVLREEEAQLALGVEWLSTEVGVPAVGKKPWMTEAGKDALRRYVESCGESLPLTGSGEVSTKAKVFKQLAERNPDSKKLAELSRQMTSLLKTSPASTVKKFLRDDRVYPSIQPEQATGRLSTTKPGMNVFGSRTDELRQQRSIVLPDNADEVLVAVDLSQIDARCMADGSGDANYAQLFGPGFDSHTEMAIRVFGDPARRKDAKALAHATNYGMGAKGFAKKSGLSVAEAEQLLQKMKLEFPLLEAFKVRLREHARARGFIKTGFGRIIAVNPHEAYTTAPAAYGQGTARDVFLQGVLELPEDVAAMIRIFVHDEIVLSVPRERATDVKKMVIETFEAVQLPCVNGVVVPVFAEGSEAGETWAQCY